MILRIILINFAVFSGILVAIESSLNVAHSIKHGITSSRLVRSGSIKDGKPIPTTWKQVFHPGVGHSHQISEFKDNPNTSDLSYDNISATESFGEKYNNNSEFRVLILGGSTTDPLGTRFSGYRGTWVHHLFEGMSNSNNSRYVIDNAGSGGSTSSNELLRLITKLHSNEYDLTISFNGINEIYFANNPYLKNKENILASSMLLEAMGEANIIKAIDGKTYLAGGILTFLRNSRTYLHLMNISKKIRPQKLNPQGINITDKDKELLIYAANTWAKNVDLMNSSSMAMNASYLAILQPTIGIGSEYCMVREQTCMLSDPRYIEELKDPNYIKRINFLYTNLRKHCNSREYCLDISNDHELTNNESLYTDPRHPNSQGNKRIADLIKDRISKLLSD